MSKHGGGKLNMIQFTLKDALKIRLMIAGLGNSLRGFSKNISISHCYLSQILDGKKNPSPQVANKIAKGLNLKIEDIFLIKMVDRSNVIDKSTGNFEKGTL